MKKHSFFGITVLGLAMTFFSGCSKLDEATQFDFHSDFEQALVVIETKESDEPVEYASSIVFDATTDSEVKKYAAKIKSFKIDKLSYYLSDNLNGVEGSVFNGTLGFNAEDNGGSATVLATITNLDLDDTSTEHDITLSEADLDKIASYLKDDKAVKIQLDGTLSKTPIHITVNVKIKATVTADAL